MIKSGVGIMMWFAILRIIDGATVVEFEDTPCNATATPIPQQQDRKIIDFYRRDARDISASVTTSLWPQISEVNKCTIERHCPEPSQTNIDNMEAEIMYSGIYSTDGIGVCQYKCYHYSLGYWSAIEGSLGTFKNSSLTLDEMMDDARDHTRFYPAIIKSSALPVIALTWLRWCVAGSPFGGRGQVLATILVYMITVVALYDTYNYWFMSVLIPNIFPLSFTLGSPSMKIAQMKYKKYKESRTVPVDHVETINLDDSANDLSIELISVETSSSSNSSEEDNTRKYIEIQGLNQADQAWYLSLVKKIDSYYDNNLRDVEGSSENEDLLPSLDSLKSDSRYNCGMLLHCWCIFGSDKDCLIEEKLEFLVCNLQERFDIIRRSPTIVVVLDHRTSSPILVQIVGYLVGLGATISNSHLGGYPNENTRITVQFVEVLELFQWPLRETIHWAAFYGDRQTLDALAKKGYTRKFISVFIELGEYELLHKYYPRVVDTCFWFYLVLMFSVIVHVMSRFPSTFASQPCRFYINNP